MTARAIQQAAVFAVLVIGQACSPDGDGTPQPPLDSGNQPVTGNDAAPAPANDAALAPPDAAKPDAAVPTDAGGATTDAAAPIDAAKPPTDATAGDAIVGPEASVGGDGGGGASCLVKPGQCNNASDCAFSKTVQDGWGLECGRMASGQGSVATTCMKGKGLTQGCAGCWGASVDCTVNNCILPCALDAMGADCKACNVKMCDPAFNTCSGF
jgi:hypothetical protein